MREADLHTVTGEVRMLLSLLESVGAGDVSLKMYRPMQEPDELPPEESEDLTERVKKYLTKLENEITHLNAENHRLNSRLRRS